MHKHSTQTANSTYRRTNYYQHQDSPIQQQQQQEVHLSEDHSEALHPEEEEDLAIEEEIAEEEVVGSEVVVGVAVGEEEEQLVEKHQNWKYESSIRMEI